MAKTTLSLKELANHSSANPADARSLRGILRRPTRPVTLSVQLMPFSVLTHNMALLVAPGHYLGIDRAGAIASIISQIRAFSPDVVGLCEVFSDGERRTIINALGDIYPARLEGPDEDDLESDGGLLLMTKHPVFDINFHIFRDCDGNDCFANKGILHMRLRQAQWPVSVDVFYSHMQDISTDEGEDTLFAQLDKMNQFVNQHRNFAMPMIIMGDLNIPGNDPRLYAQLLNRLQGPRDCWTLAGNRPDSGFTVTTNSNFYADVDDRPAQNQRLDYVLLKPGQNGVPILNQISVLEFLRNGAFISDHFGLHASFEKLASITPIP
jgi:endonuclease/exonuclease/phosphatase family metal-dependent hydrolase